MNLIHLTLWSVCVWEQTRVLYIVTMEKRKGYTKLLFAMDSVQCTVYMNHVLHLGGTHTVYTVCVCSTYLEQFYSLFNRDCVYI